MGNLKTDVSVGFGAFVGGAFLAAAVMTGVWGVGTPYQLVGPRPAECWRTEEGWQGWRGCEKRYQRTLMELEQDGTRLAICHSFIKRRETSLRKCREERMVWKRKVMLCRIRKLCDPNMKVPLGALWPKEAEDAWAQVLGRCAEDLKVCKRGLEICRTRPMPATEVP